MIRAYDVTDPVVVGPDSAGDQEADHVPKIQGSQVEERTKEGRPLRLVLEVWHPYLYDEQRDRNGKHPSLKASNLLVSPLPDPSPREFLRTSPTSFLASRPVFILLRPRRRTHDTERTQKSGDRIRQPPPLS